MARSDRERINVMFPKDVLEELRQRVPRKHRSEFIVETTAEKLAILRQHEAMEKAAGAWKDEDYPDLNTEEDLRRFIAEIRKPAGFRLVPEPDDPEQNVSL